MVYILSTKSLLDCIIFGTKRPKSDQIISFVIKGNWEKDIPVAQHKTSFYYQCTADTWTIHNISVDVIYIINLPANKYILIR